MIGTNRRRWWCNFTKNMSDEGKHALYFVSADGVAQVRNFPKGCRTPPRLSTKFSLIDFSRSINSFSRFSCLRAHYRRTQSKLFSFYSRQKWWLTISSGAGDENRDIPTRIISCTHTSCFQFVLEKVSSAFQNSSGNMKNTYLSPLD